MFINEVRQAMLPDSPQVDFKAGFLTPAGALYLGAPLNATTHASHAYKVYVALRGEFQLFMDDPRKGHCCRAAIVAPDQPHRIDGRRAVISLFYLVPETPEGQRVSRLLYGKKASAPSESTIATLMPRLRQYLDQGCSVEEAAEVCDYLFNNLLPGCRNLKAHFEPRVAGAIEYLNYDLEHRVTIAEIASAVALSPSRLEHLFAEEVGIPISRYLLSLRVRKALKGMAAGNPLTQVAQEVGFSDSAHLSRTFRRMIGIAPSYVMKNIPLFNIRPEPPAEK